MDAVLRRTPSLPALLKDQRVTAQLSIRKAAILLTSLPEETAAAVMGRLDRQEVEAVSIEIAKLGLVTGEEQNSVFDEFADANPAMLGGSSGGLDVAKTLVEKALGKGAAGTIDNVRQSIDRQARRTPAPT